MPSTGKILRRAAIAAGVLALVLALAVVLVPRIVNVGAVRKAIERTISEDLGGTVTFGQVGLSLFPHPTIELRRLTVEIPGSVSASVAAARVSVRILPLLRGRVALESAALERPEVVITLPGAAPADGGKPPLPEAKPAKRSLGNVLAVASRTMPDLSLEVSGGSLSLVREGRAFLSLKELAARLAFVQGDQQGQGPADARFHLTGDARAVISRDKVLPGSLAIAIGRLDAVPERLSIAGARAQLLDMELALDGSVGDYLSGAPQADVAASGSIGANAADWLETLAGLPTGWRLRTPVALADVRVRTSGTGAASSRELTGSLVPKDGPAVPFALRQEPGVLSVDRLEVKDGGSDARLSGTVGEKELDFAFAGALESATLLRILDRERLPFRSVRGDVRIRGPRGGTLRVSAATVGLDGYAAQDVALTLAAAAGRLAVELERATVCGISLAGHVRTADGDVDVALQPRARGRELDEDLRCLLQRASPLTGTYDLSASLTARGPRDTLLRSLHGEVEMTAKRGEIRNAKIAEGVIAYLEVKSAIKDAEAAKLREGIPYESITLRGTLKDEVVGLAKVAVKSKVIQVAAEGDVDLRGRTLDLKVLVAPLSGLDRTLSKIPLVKHIAGNALVVVPVRVEGPFAKPEVRHLPASGLGTSVVNLMKNIVQAPVNIVDPGGADP
jgi:hypothetical protein